MFYTYAHYRADDNRIFYIGKGRNRRHYQTSNRNRFWHNVVNKHGFVSKILAYWSTELESLLHEEFLIKVFRETGHSLANVTNGGTANAGPRHTDESKQRIRLSRLGKKNLPESTAKQAASIRGVPKTEEHRKNLSIARLGIKVPSTYKPIYCKTFDVVFDSVTLAAALTGSDASHIIKVCKRKMSKTNNMVFEYV